MHRAGERFRDRILDGLTVVRGEPTVNSLLDLRRHVLPLAGRVYDLKVPDEDLVGDIVSAVDNWTVVAVIDGTEYYGEGETAVSDLRRARSKVEGRDVEADMASG